MIRVAAHLRRRPDIDPEAPNVPVPGLRTETLMEETDVLADK
jgi:hypothetical protein